MSGDLRDLFQEVLLDHYRSPRRFGRLPGATHRAAGDNPLCGDRVAVELRLDGDRVAAAAFEGSGCAISTASASIMAETIEGLTRAEVERLFQRFHALVTGEGSPGGAEEELGKLVVFGGVREFPARVKCATLPWHAMRAALAAGDRGPAAPVSTETEGVIER